MEYLKLFATALLPVAILGYYIYRKDSLVPEPPRRLWKAFAYGVISCFLSLFLSAPLLLMGLYSEEPATIPGAIATSFLGAAIPEECAKLFMLWRLLRDKRYCDEWMDGIVYAVCISLGFAAIENVFYIFDNPEDWVSVGIVRALFSVPGHFGFGILMGYYYALVKFSLRDVVRHKNLVLAAPILAHGTYDTLLFSCKVIPALTLLLLPLFFFVCHKLWKYGQLKIREHLERDREFFKRMDEKNQKQR